MLCKFLRQIYPKPNRFRYRRLLGQSSRVIDLVFYRLSNAAVHYGIYNLGNDKKSA